MAGVYRLAAPFFPNWLCLKNVDRSADHDYCCFSSLPGQVEGVIPWFIYGEPL